MPTTTTTSPSLRTGIEILDEHLRGGLRPGSVVALLADPTSQSELLLAKIATARPTLYLTFQRTPDAVRRGLPRFGSDVGSLTIEAVSRDEPHETALELISDLDEPTTVIVDPATVIEGTDDERLSSFLNEAGAHLADVGGLLVLHCLRSESPPPGRVTSSYVADVIFDLETDYGWESIENRLVVPKIRGGRPVQHALKLELTDEVLVDTSRDIA